MRASFIVITVIIGIVGVRALAGTVSVNTENISQECFIGFYKKGEPQFTKGLSVAQVHKLTDQHYRYPDAKVSVSAMSSIPNGSYKGVALVCPTSYAACKIDERDMTSLVEVDDLTLLLVRAKKTKARYGVPSTMSCGISSTHERTTR